MTTPPHNPHGQGQEPWGQGPGGQQPWGPWGPPPPSTPAWGQPHGQQPYGQQPYGQPPPPRRNNPLVVAGALVAVLLVVAGLVFFTNRGSNGSGVTAAPGTTSPPSSSAGGSSSSPARTTTAAPRSSSAAGGLSVDVPVGGCVIVSGSTSSPDLTPVDCGSPEANYKVTSTASTSDGCTSDSDYVYYETSRSGSGELGALCMDVDWAEGQCFELGAENPSRVDCTVAGKDVERVAKILRGTSNDRDCPGHGVPYTDRNFVVCLDAVKTS